MDDKAWQLLMDDIHELKDNQKEMRADIKTLVQFKGWMRGWVFGIGAVSGAVAGFLTGLFK